MNIFNRTLAASPVLALIASSFGQPVWAQNDKQRFEFERPVESSSCVSGPSDRYPNYPFSVERLTQALKINGTSPETVHVLVVDNGFLGYRFVIPKNEGPSFIESNNFSPSFFDVLRDGFLPYFDASDAPLRPRDADPMNGHGTYIGGIILGGMYQKGEPRAGGANLMAPDVRRLLLDNPDADTRAAKPWLKIRYVPLGYGPLGASIDPLDKLRGALEKDGGANITIVNMSLARILPSFSTPYTLPAGVKQQMLVVLAAGNATMQLEPSLGALPARLEESEQLLIVGSHDADGKLSYFSNYGESVALAAPGCQIKSWLDGDGAAQALSGTSMSTAVVSFAAALLRSQWDTSLGAALRHRLLVSARYEPRLAECDRAASQTKIDTDPRECVDHGAMLDIEAAVIMRKDLIEYEDCPDQPGKNCTKHELVGSLSAMPQSLLRCLHLNGFPGMTYFGLTKNAAIKRIADGSFAIVIEPGHGVGRVPLRWSSCPSADADSSDTIRFRVGGLQLDGTVSPEQEIPVQTNRLIRLVTRVM